MAFYGFNWQRGDRILTAQAEYVSNYIAYLQVAQRYGVEVVAVPDDEHGQISVEALERLIDSRTRLIAITHIPTNGGLVNPAAAVGKIAKRMISPSCSTPASRLARCLSTWTLSAATCCRTTGRK